MNKNRLAASLLTLGLAIMLAPARLEAVEDVQPFNLNVIVPLSGLASFLGMQSQIVVQLGEKLINENGGIHGRPVKFVVYDDQSNPQVALQLLNQIMGSKPAPAVVIGSQTAATCNAMAPVVRNNLVQYCISPAIHPSAGSYTFAGVVSDDDVVRTQMRFFRLKGWKRLALISTTDASGQNGKRGVEESLKQPENNDVELVENVTFNPTDISVSAQIERIISARPQALLIWTTGTPFGTVLKGLTQAGIDLPVGSSYGNMTYVQMTQYANVMPKEIYFATTPWMAYSQNVSLGPEVEKAQKAFFDSFAAAGLHPDVAATTAWDVIMLVVGALRNARARRHRRAAP